MFILITLCILLVVALNFVIYRYYVLYKYTIAFNQIQEAWIYNLVFDKDISKYFKANNITKVGIIGLNDYSFLVWMELKKQGLEVLYIVDDNEHDIAPYPGIKVIKTCELERNLELVEGFVDVNVEKDFNYYLNHRYYIHNLPVISLSNLIFLSGEV